MSEQPSNLHIRPATPSDGDFVLSLVPRFVEFGPPAWRDTEHIVLTTKISLEIALDANVPQNQVLIAVDQSGTPLGFIHLQTKSDHFSNETQAYVADLAVSTQADGQGVGRALTETAEEWAQDRGCNVVTLNVFSNNRGACVFYEKLGFREETRQYVKVLDTQDEG